MTQPTSHTTFDTKTGALLRTQNWLNGTRHGPDFAYDQGNLRLARFYTHGLEDGVSTFFDSDSTLLGGYYMQEGCGTMIFLDARNRVFFSQASHKGLPHGPAYRWHWQDDHTPQLTEERLYLHGALHGRVRSWNSEGNLLDVLHYERGHLTTATAWRQDRSQDHLVPSHRRDDEHLQAMPRQLVPWLTPAQIDRLCQTRGVRIQRTSLTSCPKGAFQAESIAP